MRSMRWFEPNAGSTDDTLLNDADADGDADVDGGADGDGDTDATHIVRSSSTHTPV